MDQNIKNIPLLEKVKLVTGKDFWHSHGLLYQNIPSLTFSDGPHGVRFQADRSDHLGMFPSVKSTCYPTASALANSWDEELVLRVGQSLGKDASDLGVDVLLGPGMNIIRNPKGGRNFEYYSEDPYLTGKMASAMINGLQDHVGACMKHFAMNSQETSRMCVDECADDYTLFNLYLMPFKMAIEEADPDWVMTSYNKVNGVYANENKRLLQDVLRKQFGFQGAVVSDWGGSNDVVRGIQAGCTLEMPGTFGSSQKEIKDALKSGRLSLQDLEARAAEMVEAVQKAEERKEDEPPETFYHGKYPHTVAVEAAAKSAVLLKNKDHILPLKPQQKIAFIGPFEENYPIQGGGSSKTEPKKNPSFQDLLRQSPFKNTVTVKGYNPFSRETDPDLHKEALQAMEDSDVIVLLAGYLEMENLEGMDRQSVKLYPAVCDLILKASRMNKPVVLVDAIAGPIELDQEDDLHAVLYTGLAGEGAREALLKLLSGEINPSGKLAQSFAKSWSQYPNSRFYPSLGAKSIHAEGMNVGYRALDNLGVKARYPFGYGLSYADFKISNVKVNPDGIHFDLENVSNVDGAEVVQLYVSRDQSRMKELKGFEKVELKAHQKRKCFIPFDSYTFSSYHPDYDRWEKISGRYKLMLSRNGRDMDAVRFMDVEDGVEPYKYVPLEQKESEPFSYSMECPLKTFTDSPSWLVKNTARLIEKRADRSIANGKPETVSLALKEMPLKGLCKTSGQYFSSEDAKQILNTASNPSLKNYKSLLKAGFQKLVH